MENLLYLTLLACPVVMGLMMWMMRPKQNRADEPTTTEDELSRLRPEVDTLRAGLGDSDSRRRRQLG